jgi:hypothetical protein
MFRHVLRGSGIALALALISVGTAEAYITFNPQTHQIVCTPCKVIIHQDGSSDYTSNNPDWLHFNPDGSGYGNLAGSDISFGAPSASGSGGGSHGGVPTQPDY